MCLDPHLDRHSCFKFFLQSQPTEAMWLLSFVLWMRKLSYGRTVSSSEPSRLLGAPLTLGPQHSNPRAGQDVRILSGWSPAQFLPSEQFSRGLCYCISLGHFWSLLCGVHSAKPSWKVHLGSPGWTGEGSDCKQRPRPTLTWVSPF